MNLFRKVILWFRIKLGKGRDVKRKSSEEELVYKETYEQLF
jgi:hypothetical protein